MTGHRPSRLWQPRDAEDFLYRRVGPVSLYLGQAHDVLAGMPADSVDTIVCSPPYWQLRDYQTGRWVGGDPACDLHPGRRPRRGGDRDDERCPACRAWWDDPQTGLEDDLDHYLAVLVYTLSLARRVLKETGTLWLNIGDRYVTSHGIARPAAVLPAHLDSRDATHARVLEPKQLLGIPWRTALALQREGWWLRNAIVWTKTNPSPESVTDRLSTTYELVFLLTRSPRYFFDLDPIRLPLKHPDAADGSRVFGGANKAGHGGVDSAARRRGNTYGTATGARQGKYTPEATEARMRAHRGNLAVTGAAHTAAHRRGRNPGDTWALPTRPYRGAHSAPFPIDIPLRAIAAGCPPGGHVLDPYSGAGTTGLAALQLGCTYSGIDISPTFHDLALARLTPHLPDPDIDHGPGGGGG